MRRKLPWLITATVELFSLTTIKNKPPKKLPSKLLIHPKEEPSHLALLTLIYSKIATMKSTTVIGNIVRRLAWNIRNVFFRLPTRIIGGTGFLIFSRRHYRHYLEHPGEKADLGSQTRYWKMLNHNSSLRSRCKEIEFLYNANGTWRYNLNCGMTCWKIINPI
jgi:hypothetical protein